MEEEREEGEQAPWLLAWVAPLRLWPLLWKMGWGGVLGHRGKLFADLNMEGRVLHGSDFIRQEGWRRASFWK